MANHFWGLCQRIRSRIFVDVYATDSLQNIFLPVQQMPLFIQALQANPPDPPFPSPATLSINPGTITTVSHMFKRARFTELHFPSFKDRPVASWKFVGVDPPMGDEKKAEVESLEYENAYMLWKADPEGIGEALSGKRKRRGWTDDRERSFAELLDGGAYQTQKRP